MLSLIDWFNLQETTYSLWHYAEPKIVFSLVLSTYSFFLDPGYSQLVLALLVLICFDAVTGIMASKLNNIPITAKGVFKTPKKMFVYIILVSSAHLADMFILGQGAYFEIFMLFFLAFTEFASILENTGRLGYKTPKKILNQFSEQLEIKKR